MRALDLRSFRSEGFFKKQKNKKNTKTENNKKTKKCKKMQKREKKSKNEQKTTGFLASLLWSRAFIYLHVVLQLGGGGQGMPIIQAMLSSLSNCQLLSSVVNCYLFNEMQCFSFRTWSARTDWNDSTH